MPYRFHSKIRYSETGEDERLTLPEMINYFQDCSTFQSEEIGNGVEEMFARGKAWILAYWQIELVRMPMLGENITVETWAHAFKGFQGDRNYRMLDEQGKMLGCANSLWIYLDLQTGHPVRVDKSVQEVYELEPALPMEKTSRKIEMPEDYKEEDCIEVRKYHLDTNHHVNNVQYIAIAAEFLPDKAVVRRIRAEYKNSAKKGDHIIPQISRRDEMLTVSLCDEQRKPYAIIEFLIER